MRYVICTELAWIGVILYGTQPFLFIDYPFTLPFVLFYRSQSHPHSIICFTKVMYLHSSKEKAAKRLFTRARY
jgi:hypothetical protein